ncbi:MAG: DUF4367 domain-containing protein [Ruminococcus sp.]|nr:DUF4367 domain-containing protein [Ruminococcus sp.]
MADRKLNSDYDDALLNLAVSDMLEDYGRELEKKYKDVEDVPPSPEAAEKFERELNKAYRNGQLRSFRTKAVKFSKYAVTVCAAFIVVFAVSVVSVDALRLRFLEWLFNIHESHSSLKINTNNSAYYDIIHADYMIDGYELINYNNDGDLIEICYSNNINNVKIYVYLDYFTFNTDNENTSSEEVYINGNNGQYQKKESTSTIFWYSGKQSYCVSTNDMQITKDELIEIAQSVN